MTRPTFACLFLCIALISGCHNAGTVPPGWRGHPITIDDTGIDPSTQLQVIVCYGKVLSNHSAIRLTVPDKPAVLWDPGGTFLQDEPDHARRHDVITRNAPTIDRWWQYRRDGCREPVMEVFQWSLAPDQANRLHTILTDYQDPTDPTQAFEPDAGGLQCCKKVTEFLIRFAEDRPRIDEKMFWPHKLGEHLWTQNPDSVLIFRSEGDSLEYLKSGDSRRAE